jgi:hypothetical protein
MNLYTTDYKFKHVYNINTLKDYCGYAERDIKRAEEVIQKIREYQRELFDHVQIVLQTDIKKVVVLNRSEDYSSKKKFYHVYLDHRPVTEQKQANGNWITGDHTDFQKFTGTERNQAISYAEQLAKSNRCEIEKTGRWSK